MTLGDKLSKLRKENNYTQEQLADILGASRQAISKWENDISYPETDKLIRMSELFCSKTQRKRTVKISTMRKSSFSESVCVREKVKKHYGVCPCGILAGTQGALLRWD